MLSEKQLLATVSLSKYEDMHTAVTLTVCEKDTDQIKSKGA